MIYGVAADLLATRIMIDEDSPDHHDLDHNDVSGVSTPIVLHSLAIPVQAIVQKTAPKPH
jgi:hypothetical protein